MDWVDFAVLVYFVATTPFTLVGGFSLYTLTSAILAAREDRRQDRE